MAITFDGFDIDDGVNYVTQRDDERNQPERELHQTGIARREGSKFLGSEYKRKTIKVKGVVFADDTTTFKEKLDDLKENLAGEEKTLSFEPDRSYTATVSNLVVPKDENSITFGDFTADFVVNTPFALGNAQTVSFTVTSGITTVSGIVTISGTVFARPTISYNAPSGSGDTLVDRIVIAHTPTGETLTWSGASNDQFVDYGTSVAFNYNNLTVLQDTTARDWIGIFSRWEPGANAFTVTFSGVAQGGTVQFTYQPRYL